MRRPSPPSARRPRLVGAGLVAAAVLAAGAGGGALLAWREGPPPDRVGACRFGPSCWALGCHWSFGLGSTTLAWDLTEEAPEPGPLPAWYVPGRLYDLRLTVADTDPGAVIWGFELAPLSCLTGAGPAGQLALAEPGRTRVFVDGANVGYVSHSCTCPAETPDCCGYVPFGSGGNSWAFSWVAPPRGTGEVSFAVAFNAANWDGTPDGDRITLGEALLQEESCPPPVRDLTVRLAACDPGAPSEARVELAFTSSGEPPIVRATDEAGLATPRETWGDAGGTCVPLDPRPLAFYSVAEPCLLGSEGEH